MRREFEVKSWRSVYDVISCLFVIALAIYATLSISWWLYPIAAILIANRLLALSLICHEGLHSTLSLNRKWNDFFGRYFCAFPAYISFSKHRRLHLLHHSSVGHMTWDPDRHLYDFFPISIGQYVKQQLKNILTLKTCWSFLQYYTDLPELVQMLRGRFHFSKLNKANDLIPFLIYNFILIVVLLVTHTWPYYLAFILIPLIFITQPYVLLMGGLQHGPIHKTNPTEQGPSRTVRGSKIFMWLLLPLDINYHAEHHLNPSVPHYWLSRYSKKLEQSGVALWKETYSMSLKRLFSQNETIS